MSVMSPAEPAHTMWSNAKKAAMDSALAWADGQRVSLGESGNPTRGRSRAQAGGAGRDLAQSSSVARLCDHGERRHLRRRLEQRQHALRWL